MKKTLFIFSFASSLVFSPFSEARSLNLSCKLDQLQNVDVFLDAELNLRSYPILHYKEEARQWSLQVGSLTLDPAQSQSQDLRKRRLKKSDHKILVAFWIQGVRWYDLEIDQAQNYARLYWWGTVKRSLVATFQCR